MGVRKSKCPLIKIDAASVFPEMTYEDTDGDDILIKFPEPNPDYNLLTLIDDIPWASKDGKEWVIACGVVIDGEPLSPIKVCKSLMEYLEKENNDGSKL